MRTKSTVDWDHNEKADIGVEGVALVLVKSTDKTEKVIQILSALDDDWHNETSTGTSWDEVKQSLMPKGSLRQWVDSLTRLIISFSAMEF